MKRTAARIGLAAALAVGIMVLLEQGCSPAQTRTVEANGTYAAQVAACVKEATSKASGIACLDRVDRAWGLADGGAE